MRTHFVIRAFLVVGMLLVAGFLTFRPLSDVQPGGAAWAGPRPVETPVTIHPPLGLPPVPIPADNPPTADTIALGRRLYYDTALSIDKTVSCATCHAPNMGFTD